MIDLIEVLIYEENNYLYSVQTRSCGVARARVLPNRCIHHVKISTHSKQILKSQIQCQEIASLPTCLLLTFFLFSFSDKRTSRNRKKCIGLKVAGYKSELYCCRFAADIYEIGYPFPFPVPPLLSSTIGLWSALHVLYCIRACLSTYDCILVIIFS